MPTLVQCGPERHAQAILAILNEAIETSTALYDYHPRSQASMQAWFQTKIAHGFPVIGLENDAGQLLGFATYGTFRAWPAYQYSVEHSVYVHRDHRGQGLGHQLMQALIQTAQEREVHTLIGVIDSANAGSQQLHTRLGFKPAGTLHQAGFKFGRWLDVDFYQLILKTPSHPVDG